jgi:hypothetical protein
MSSDLLRVDSDYKVFWRGREVGILATPIQTDYQYSVRHAGFEDSKTRVSFDMYEPLPKPKPKPKRRKRTDLGLRRPK